ncbi:hypothetical protein [Azospirillum agricola]|uniref:hypothetical protein n=1 Tax=Azospirillum agricola TaxID=1720247 RepID=UPI000A0F3040|nr:hypothetical protein [Azospirillum agricola]SMH59596.1 hypothetical protein SAMN02982994_5118 [Azospirillum lipoferum]
MGRRMGGRTRNTGRRDILRGLAAGGAVLLSGSGAGAITARPSSDYGAVLDAACGPSADHARQIAEIENAFGLTRPDPRMIERLRRTACPNCGCPLMPPAGPSDAF